MITKPLSAIAALLLLGAAQTHATQIVRELFDGLNAGHDYTTINGLTTDVTSVGLQGAWSVSPQGTIDGTNVTSTGIVYKDTWSLDWPLGSIDGSVLSHSAGRNGLLNFNPGGNLNALIDPNTGNPYGNQASLSYATHPLASSSYVSFTNNGTYYFSVRIVKSYSWYVGDNSEGIGLSTGNGTNAHFVGFGVTRPSCLLADNTTDIGSAAYVSTGTLGQAGISSHPDDTGGPYLPLSWGAAGQWVGWDWVRAGLLVGQLTTTTSGASTLSVKSYTSGATVDTDPNLITWDATYNFNETNTMTQLLVWMHGTGALEYDAIRVGTTYGDAVGIELIGSPAASPSVTNYAGTAVTISQSAGLNTGTFPMSFQWRSNNVDQVDATNSSLSLTATTTNFTADYSVVVSNYYGMYTSAVTHVTFLPAVPPFIVTQPVSLTRYVGSPAASFTVIANGTPPFTYQWKHAGTNIQSAVTTASMTNTLTLPPITLLEIGSYTVTITNLFGSTNSATAMLTEIVPPAGSYAAAVTALSPYGYWALDDNATTNDPTIHDYWGNHSGQAVDVVNSPNMIFGIAGPSYSGFSQPHSAVRLGDQFWLGAYRLNLPKLPNYATNMTFTMWVKGGCQFLNRNGYGNAYGLENNSGSLQFDWPGITSWNSGLTVPSDWTFVALVVEPTQATIYVGTNQVSLVSAKSGAIGPIADSATLGDTAGLYPLGIARNQWPWAEDGNGAPWASTPSSWSDVAIYYQSLTPQQITSLYLAAVGLGVQGTPDGSGNLVLNWISGATLQEATSVTGPWTDVGGSPTPPYSVPMTAAQKFYRVKN